MALAQAIAAQNGQDVKLVYSEVTYVKTVGGNADFQPDEDIDLSFLNDDDSYRAGDTPSVHEHTSDGLIHLDTANPHSVPPFGLLGHFIFDVLLGNINSSVPMEH